MNKPCYIYFFAIIALIVHGCTHNNFERSFPEQNVQGLTNNIKEEKISQLVRKGDNNYQNGNYKQAGKEYLKIYFIDPANSMALDKLRRLPAFRSQTNIVRSRIKNSTIHYGRHITYNIKTGDTLRGISLRFYGDPEKYPLLAEANKIRSPYILYTGQSLILPKSLGGTDFKKP